jgi:hypothetical protein
VGPFPTIFEVAPVREQQHFWSDRELSVVLSTARLQFIAALSTIRLQVPI